MKLKRKSKTHVKRRSALPLVTVERTYEIIKSRHHPSKESKTFTRMETGEPDREPMPDNHNPQAVQGGLGPLNQEGEGNRQSAELAELEQIEPNINREQK